MPVAVDRRLGPGTLVMRSRTFLCIAITAASCAIVLIAAVLGHGTIWNLSSSVPRGLYAAMLHQPCRRGSLVSFSPPPGAAAIIYSRDYLPVGAGLIKQIVGVPGDHVCIRSDGLFVNGVRLGDVARSDSRGRPLAPYPFCGVIAPGQAFVATKAPLSYDSRYFGPVPIVSMTVVVPVWTY